MSHQGVIPLKPLILIIPRASSRGIIRIKVNKYLKSTQLLLQILFFLLIIYIPSNLFLSLLPQISYVRGLMVDYQIPKIYASQIIIFNLINLWFFRRNLFNKERIKSFLVSNKLLIVLTTAIFVRQFFTLNPASSVWFLFQAVSSILLFFFLNNHRWLLKKKLFSWAIFSSATLQFLLAIFQFIYQHSLLPYQVIGEPRFEPYFRMSRHLFDGKEKILSYGSTAHPNTLAGTLVIFCLILLIKFLNKRSIQNKIFWEISLLFALIVLYTTQSFSAYLSLVVGGGIIFLEHFLKKETSKEMFNKLLALATLLIFLFSPLLILQVAKYYPHEPSISRRNSLNQVAVAITKDNWLLGSGLNQLILYLDNYGQPEAIRFLQPTHHVGLLFLAENGAIGLMILVIVGKKCKKEVRKSIVLATAILTPILVLDHYFYTLQAGQLLFSLLLVVLLTELDQLKE